MPDRGMTMRWAVLTVAAALGVHAGRFAVAPAHGDTAHAYLSWLAPAVLAAVLAASLAFLRALARTRHGGQAPAAPPEQIWATTTLLLLAVFGLQELAEAWLGGAGGHGLHGLLGEGAWAALPLAGAFGALVAAGVRTAHALLVRAAGSRAPTRRLTEARRRRDTRGHAPAPITRRLAGRGPPVVTAAAA